MARICWVFSLGALLFCTGCADLFLNRTYQSQMLLDRDQFFVAGRDFAVVPGDRDNPYRSDEEIQRRTPASGPEALRHQRDAALQDELAQKESMLSGSEYQKYLKAKENLEGISERIYYLNLNPQDRETYLISRGINEYKAPRMTYQQQRSQFFLLSGQDYTAQELERGMTKEQLLHLYGQPAKIEVAGNPAYQNERWSFKVNGRWQWVYLENGRVVGLNAD
ncbi:MAG: hypothetical protein J6Y94_04505 [Bacteriovoracaceae bacterium]|nr:hypothetical protein [Bacteriovoracaceae bacterium]